MKYYQPSSCWLAFLYQHLNFTFIKKIIYQHLLLRRPKNLPTCGSASPRVTINLVLPLSQIMWHLSDFEIQISLSLTIIFHISVKYFELSIIVTYSLKKVQKFHTQIQPSNLNSLTLDIWTATHKLGHREYCDTIHFGQSLHFFPKILPIKNMCSSMSYQFLI